MNWNEIRNNTSFVSEVTEYFASISGEGPLRFHQELLEKYFQKYPVRGMLIFHKMGFGKTLLAAAVSNHLAEAGYNTVFISAKTLHSNFSQTLDKFTKLTGRKFTGEISFVSLNASNMMDQVDRSTMGSIETFLDSKKVMQGSLNGKLIIIDEAHNFFNSIANGSKNATRLYKAIMRSKCRLLFLTGSPIVNDPFEIALCFNMLSGMQLFGEDYKDFTQAFIYSDQANEQKRLKNVGKFCNRINGMVSFYDAGARTGQSEDFDFPELRPVKVIEVVMSKPQYKEYLAARKVELESQMTRRVWKATPLQKPKVNANYRVATRQLCNFLYPEYATVKTKDELGKVTVRANFELLDQADLVKNINTYSPKFAKLVDTACTEPGIGLVYSQFLGYGLKVLDALFRARGVSTAVISGEVDKREVDRLLEIINSPANADGSQIKIVLISSTATEGVDFKNIRHIHLEPFWHASREAQIIGRGVRANSHISLPKKDRYVQPYVYISVHGIAGNYEQTTDQYLYTKSKANAQLINSFYTAIQMSAVDCHTHYDNCRTCAATNRKLFTENLAIDLTLPDACVAETDATVFELDGKSYARYEEDGEEKFAKRVGDKWVPVTEELAEYIKKQIVQN